MSKGLRTAALLMTSARAHMYMCGATLALRFCRAGATPHSNVKAVQGKY